MSIDKQLERVEADAQRIKDNRKADAKLLRIMDALIYTCNNVTDLDNVYNDDTGESYSWAEVQEAYDELSRRSHGF